MSHVFKLNRLPLFVKDTGPLLLDILERPEGVDTLQRIWFDTKNYLTLVRGIRIKAEARKLGNLHSFDFCCTNILCYALVEFLIYVTNLKFFAGTIKLDKLLKPQGREGFLATGPTYVGLTRAQLEDLLDSELHLDQLDKVSG